MIPMNLWEKDKRVILKYQNCVKEFMEQVRAGEEVDWEDACAVEQGKVNQYLSDMIYTYKYKNPTAFDDNRASMYTPRLPYFQDF